MFLNKCRPRRRSRYQENLVAAEMLRIVILRVTASQTAHVRIMKDAREQLDLAEAEIRQYEAARG